MAAKLEHESELRCLRCVNENLAMDAALDGVDLRVALYLVSKLNFTSFKVVQVNELAAMLGRRSEHVSRSIRKLESSGVIIPGSKVGRSVEWRLNPEYGKAMRA
jgi:predicted transcriptional regulator